MAVASSGTLAPPRFAPASLGVRDSLVANEKRHGATGEMIRSYLFSECHRKARVSTSIAPGSRRIALSAETVPVSLQHNTIDCGAYVLQFVVVVLRWASAVAETDRDSTLFHSYYPYSASHAPHALNLPSLPLLFLPLPSFMARQAATPRQLGRRAEPRRRRSAP